jgi:hypothetical protein
VLKHLLELLKSNVPEFHTLESPQQQAPNIQIASTTCPAVTVPEQTVSEQLIESLSIPENVIELDFMITSKASDVEIEQSNSSSTMIVTSVPDQSSDTIIQTPTSINNQPSSSNLAIQPCAPAKANVPSPPTLFLDSTILANVCENIFQELNKLIQARNDLIRKEINGRD